jgi:UDP-GlcNAc:undecaprenyl-phosphate GlcNAc-1-phosphate transferase
MNEVAGYVAAFGIATVLSVLLTPAMMRLARRWSLLDVPSSATAHETATPYLGGVAISLSFLVAVAIAALIDPPGARGGELTMVLIVAAALTIAGLIDDLWGLPIAARLGVEIVGAIAIWEFGEGAQLFGEPIIDATITVLWIVGVVNAFNLLDHHDGLSAGVALIAAGWFFVLAAINDQQLVASFAIGLAGCSLGFLRMNFPPARIFMGDAGSLFLGFLLAVIGLKLSFPDNDRSVTFLTPVFVVGLALFDTTLVVVSRLSSGTSPLQGGRDHSAHRLRSMGVPNRAIAVLLYVAAVASGWVGLIISLSGRLNAYLLAGLAAFLALVAGLMMLAVPVLGVRTPASVAALQRTLGWEQPSEGRPRGGSPPD